VDYLHAWGILLGDDTPPRKSKILKKKKNKEN